MLMLERFIKFCEYVNSVTIKLYTGKFDFKKPKLDLPQTNAQADTINSIL